MIIVSANVWPGGSQAEAYELLHASISNQGPSSTGGESFIAHVLSRPNKYTGVEGFEADVEVSGHRHSAGFAPLLMSILAAAWSTDPDKGIMIPPSRALARLTLTDVHEFTQLLKGRS